MKTKNNGILLDEATIKFIVKKLKEIIDKIINLVRNFILSTKEEE